MTLKARRFIFFLFFLFFLLGGVGTVLYSTGWRPQLAPLTLQQTGSIFIKTVPQDAALEIQGRAVKNQSWLLQKGTLVSGLPEGVYDVAVSKSGYRPWKKNLSVRPSLVTEASHIILLPEKMTFSVVGTEAESFFLKGGNVILRRADDAMAIVDITADGQSAVFYSEKNGNYYAAKIADPDSFLNLNVIFNNLKERILELPGTVPVVDVQSHPFDSDQFIIASRSALYLIDVARLTIEALTLHRVDDFAVGSGRVFWAEGNAVWSYNFIFKTKSKAADLEEPVRKIILSSDGTSIAVIGASGTLFAPSTGTLADGRQGFSAIAPYAEKAAFSPDGRILAFLTGGDSLNLYFMRDVIGEINKQAGNRVKLKLGRGRIDDFSWHHDSFHIFAAAGGSLLFTEIDNRLPLNVYELEEGVERYAYDEENKALYFLKDGTLYKADFNF